MASTYSTIADLMIGDLPIAPVIDRQKYVDDAADEIDSTIGHIYATPIDMTPAGPVKRPSRLLIQRIARFLSTGRVILAVATPTENQTLHAYGKQMVDEALAALNAIAQGEPPLEGAEPADPEDEIHSSSGPLISNIDSFSQVEEFYQLMSETPWGYGYRAAGG